MCDGYVGGKCPTSRDNICCVAKAAMDMTDVAWCTSCLTYFFLASEQGQLLYHSTHTTVIRPTAAALKSYVPCSISTITTNVYIV